VLDALRRPATIDGRPVQLRASIGIAMGHAGSQAEELLRDADSAMYAAKAKGKGLCEVFEPEVHQPVLAAVPALPLAEQLQE
jgi:predicted signal transduction protein with EAL and GGDEF domain